MGLWIEETHVDEEDGCLLDNPFSYETYHDHTGELFRSLQREHGRCVSAMYIETEDGRDHTVGWVFSKRRPYSDCEKTYIHTVWVAVLKGPPVTTTTYQYATI